MEWIDRLKRLLKLGFFIGAGTISALASACGDSSSATDAGVQTDADIGVQKDASVSDTKASDLTAQDAPLGTDLTDANELDTSPSDSEAGWDIPLE